ncbi:MAG: alpha/beta fold hydrolase [Acidimicrobiales bacterium]|jgi:pimeloyl-ACP methyl ester carboxylesterase
MCIPTYLLVHGGWSGAWCWQKLAHEFDRRAIKWIAIDLPSSKKGAKPSTDLAADAATVASTVHRDGHYILVGHHYGGAVVTEVAPRIPNLERIIYIAALVPKEGQSATETARAVRVPTKLDEAIEVDGEYLRLNRNIAAAALYSDCPAVIASWAVDKLTPQTVASFRSRRSSADCDVESLYIRCTLDRALDPLLQEHMADRCDIVFDLASDHSPFLSQPTNLLEAMLS